MDLKWSSSGNTEMQKHLHKFMRNLHCFAFIIIFMKNNSSLFQTIFFLYIETAIYQVLQVKSLDNIHWC